jgi:hypothetical protein
MSSCDFIVNLSKRILMPPDLMKIIHTGPQRHEDTKNCFKKFLCVLSELGVKTAYLKAAVNPKNKHIKYYVNWKEL